MKRATLTLLAMLCVVSLMAQQHNSKSKSAKGYEITFTLAKPTYEKLYIGQHYCDRLIVTDSAERGADGSYLFRGTQRPAKGIYTLIDSSKKKSLMDFCIDGSYRFSIACDSTLKHEGATVKGCNANSAMFAYIGEINKARTLSRDIEKRKKSTDAKVKANADQEMEQLSQKMEQLEKSCFEQHQALLFFQNLKMFRGADIPETVAEDDKPYYYRAHYWDGVDWSRHDLRYTPDLFNKVNYYFFGVLYHADADTICKYADMTLNAMQGDTAMMRYVLDFVMPKYYRSTKNVGWDQVWCYLVRQYYLSGRCPWATEADIFNKRQTVEFLEKSLIGAYGAELFMADTNQSTDPNQWISSHRFPEKYVILWFWDPDCHHCQEQTATLIALYDSISRAPEKPFEVYAVGYEADVAKWKRYIVKHGLPFVNVGGSNVNIDYQEAYNIHGAPTMIILNADRQIIMNKTLPTKSILPFIRDYEKKHPEQANRQPSRWQMEGMKLKASRQ